MTELRRAVIYCLSTNSNFTEQDIIGLCPTITKSAVVRYLSILVHCEVLNRKDDTFGPGPEAAEWRKRPSNTHAGGNAKAYRAAKVQREQMVARTQQGDETRGLLTCQDRTHQDRRAQMRTRQDNLPLAMKFGMVYTVEEVASILRVSQKTVLRKLRSRQYRGTKIGRLWRIHSDEFQRIATCRFDISQEDSICQ